MPIAQGGFWVPNLAPKQLEIFNAYKRLVLVSGPRKSSKTIGVLHRLARHAWETPDARVGIFTKTIKNALNGVWDILYKTVLGEWADNLDGFRITKPLSIDGTTRMHYFRIANQHGGESEFQLHSLDNDNEVEEKMKATVFSCIFVSELTNFRTDKVFRFTTPQLRMPHLRHDQHQWISDTNPDEIDGDQFWAYKIWYEERIQEGHPYPSFQTQLQLIECQIADNPFLQKEEIDELHATNAHDPDMFAVYVEGKWIQTSRDSLFTGVFKQGSHVVGGEEDLWPEQDCVELITGWDPGDRNKSAHIHEKVVRGNLTYWKTIDELVILDNDIEIEEFAILFSEMMDEWEERCGKKFRWIHWSDSAATNARSSAHLDQMRILNATNGRIRVEGAPKYEGSVPERVKMARNLLLTNRWYVSERCEKLIASLRGGLKRDRTRKSYLKNNQHKHPFDSATYPILAESSFDLSFGPTPNIVQSSLVSARL